MGERKIIGRDNAQKQKLQNKIRDAMEVMKQVKRPFSKGPEKAER